MEEKVKIFDLKKYSLQDWRLRKEKIVLTAIFWILKINLVCLLSNPQIATAYARWG
uniref:Uncharacterized protein n=1 Tax=Aster yellows phytoplasma TaxID=35779 RepID=Q847N8_ASTYP|nr:hypothetical protein [Aster yellows phytoplasma]